MRAALGLLFLAVLLVQACSPEPAPSLSPAPQPVTPAAAQPTPTLLLPGPASTTAPATAAEAAQPFTVPAGAPGLPAYLRTLDFRVPAGNTYYPQALALHPGLKRLYARTHALGWDSAATIAVLDAASGEVLQTTETGPDDYGFGDLAVDPIRDRVYAVNREGRTASVLEAGSLAPVTILQDVEQLALDARAGIVAVAGQTGLRTLDAATYAALRQSPLPEGDSPFDLALDLTAGCIYLAVQDSQGYSLLTYDAATLSQLSGLQLPGQPDALVANPARAEAYVTASDAQQNLLWTVGGEGTLLEQRRLGDSSRRTSLAVDGEGRRLFLGRSEYSHYAVEVLDIETGQQVAEIPAGYVPNSLLYDERNDHLWVGLTYENRIADIDLEAGSLHATYPTALGVSDLEVDPARGRLLVADTAGRLHVLDSDSDVGLALLPGGSQVAVDAAHGRYYTGGWAVASVRIIDADTIAQTGEVPFSGVPVADAHSGGLYVVHEGIHLVDLDSLSITGVISDTLPQMPGYSPNPTAVDAVVDPGTGRIFAIISNGVPGSNGGTYLNVYEPVTFQKVLEDTERSPTYVDVNPANGWAYVSRTHLAGSSTSLLVGGRTYTARVDSLYGGTRLDATLGRVYVSACGDGACQMVILDANTLDVLDSVPIPDDYNLAALDPVRHLLYLVRSDGLVQVWSAAGGDRPLAAPPQPAVLAQDGIPLRVFAPQGDEPLFATDSGQRLCRTDDANASWVSVTGGLPRARIGDLAVSPAFGQDRTLFAGLGGGTQGFGVWKSTDGGSSWRLSSRGLTDLSVSLLALSPSFSTDHTLFVSTGHGGLYRSTDGGETWVGLSHLYRVPGAYPSGPLQILLSPTFGQDRTLFIDHDGFRRSEDGGDTWHALADVGGGSFFFERHLILAPDYASSHAVYCLSISQEPGGRAYLLGSADGGDTWADLGQGPAPQQQGAGRLLVAPQGVAYLAWVPWYPSTEVELYRSSGLLPVEGLPVPLTWERYAGSPIEPATPLVLTGDGTAFLALDAAGRLQSWPVAGLTWQPVVPPTPMPSPTPMPTAGPCTSEPARFHAAWEQNQVALGCPLGQEQQAQLAWQQFDKGLMIWDSTDRQIYVLAGWSGTWKAYPDTWQEGEDLAWDPALTPPPRQPQRGFGKVWRERLGGESADIGWAKDTERSVEGWKQQFSRGVLFWTDLQLPDAPSTGTQFVLFGDGDWLFAPGP